MPPPTPDEVRAAILEAIRQGGKSTRQIGREHGVSDATVRKIAKDHGLTDAFSREQTENATRARMADLKAQRTLLSQRLVAKAHDLLDQMDQPCMVFNFGGKDNTYNEHQLERPPVSDLRNLMTAAAVAIDKHVVLDRHDTDSGAGEAASMLGALADGLGQAYRQITKTSDTDDSTDGGGG